MTNLQRLRRQREALKLLLEDSRKAVTNERSRIWARDHREQMNAARRARVAAKRANPRP